MTKKMTKMITNIRNNRKGMPGLIIGSATDAGLYIVMIGIIIFFAIKSPYFLTIRNILNMLIAVSVIGITAPTMTMALVCRGADLTAGSIMAMSACICSLLVESYSCPWYLAIGASLLVGLIVGLVNGAIITKLNIPPMVVTLGMMSMVRGIAFIITGGLSIYASDRSLTWFGVGRIGGVFPVAVLIMLVSFVVYAFITKKTVFGRNIYAVGGNSTASRLAGINTKRVIATVFILNGLMASISGIVMLGITSTALPSAAESYALDTVTAVLLGGTALDGGEGSVVRTFLGLLIIGLINNGMALLNVPSFWQTFAKGALLLLAVVFDRMRKR